jgi:malonyl-ACP decarboxylase
MRPEARIVVTGLGVTSPVGQGSEAFLAGLLHGGNAFRVMQRPGRQKDSAFLGAEIEALTLPQGVTAQLRRTLSLSAAAALVALDEAWHEAQLEQLESDRVGLIVGGNNFQQRELLQTQEKYAHSRAFLRPTYGMGFMDSDVCGVCTAQYAIHGPSYTVGAASASGQLAIIQAAEAVRSGRVEACIALGALMDLSYWECQGLRSLGAMGSERYAQQPAAACRPFDCDRDGFVFGESCGALVLESARSAAARGVRPYAEMAGWSMVMDGNRNPDPSLDGEVVAIERALREAGCAPGEIDYVNPHGSGSLLGDEIEIQAIRQAGLAQARINATKSIVGHGLTAAGAVEAIATLLQMEAGRLHPTRNLLNPIDDSLLWVQEQSVTHEMNNALTLSMGFGGVNTAVCFRRAVAA